MPPLEKAALSPAPDTSLFPSKNLVSQRKLPSAGLRIGFSEERGVTLFETGKFLVTPLGREVSSFEPRVLLLALHCVGFVCEMRRVMSILPVERPVPVRSERKKGAEKPDHLGLRDHQRVALPRPLDGLVARAAPVGAAYAERAPSKRRARLELSHSEVVV